MSSINTSAANTPSANLGNGLEMGQMGEGGGQNFYMGGQQGEGKEEEQQGNPELVVLDQAKENDKTQNRQYLENLITGSATHHAWTNPWEVPADRRDNKTKNTERKDMNIAPSEAPRRKKTFIINA